PNAIILTPSPRSSPNPKRAPWWPYRYRKKSVSGASLSPAVIHHCGSVWWMPGHKPEKSKTCLPSLPKSYGTVGLPPCPIVSETSTELHRRWDGQPFHLLCCTDSWVSYL